MAKQFNKETLALIAKAANQVTDEILHGNGDISYHGDTFVGINTGDSKISATIYKDGSISLTISKDETNTESRTEAYKKMKTEALTSEIKHLDESKKKLQTEIDKLNQKEGQQ